jgi:hypothetical protein
VAYEGDNRTHYLVSMLLKVAQRIIGELSRFRVLLVGVQADDNASACRITVELRIVSCGDPDDTGGDADITVWLFTGDQVCISTTNTIESLNRCP